MTDRLTPDQEETLLDIIAVQKRDCEDTGERMTLEELAESVGVEFDDLGHPKERDNG